MLARLALLVLAVAVVGWLGVSVVSSRAQDELIDVGVPHHGPAPDRERVRALAERARLLTRDRRADLAEGVALRRLGDTAGAVRAFERVARTEPENVEAWALLARDADPPLAAEARRRLRALAPPVPSVPG
jgi:Flp pilus assembly protein TadD